jgi:hypothetical protein
MVLGSTAEPDARFQASSGGNDVLANDDAISVVLLSIFVRVGECCSAACLARIGAAG